MTILVPGVGFIKARDDDVMWSDLKQCFYTWGYKINEDGSLSNECLLYGFHLYLI
jgi:hypothetical protein